MLALIIDRTDLLLSSLDLPDGDFAFLGNGAMTATVTHPGIPHRLLLTENGGRIIGEGRFFKDIALDKQWHNPGDQITIRLSLN